MSWGISRDELWVTPKLWNDGHGEEGVIPACKQTRHDPGGTGTIFGSVVGALIIGTLNAGAQQAGWPKWIQEVAIGAIIIGAVAIDQLRHRQS
jgi:ABC-type glucose/galactose transport system permease subunit